MNYPELNYHYFMGELREAARTRQILFGGNDYDSNDCDCVFFSSVFGRVLQWLRTISVIFAVGLLRLEMNFEFTEQ